MSFVNQRHEPRAIDMGVDLGGRDIRVAQHRLQHAKIRPALQKVSRKRMAQDVRAHLFMSDSGSPGQFAQELK